MYGCGLTKDLKALRQKIKFSIRGYSAQNLRIVGCDAGMKGWGPKVLKKQNLEVYGFLIASRVVVK